MRSRRLCAYFRLLPAPRLLTLCPPVPRPAPPLPPGGKAKAAVSAEPTMMSQEARNLFLNGDKDSGLAAWKVGSSKAGW